MKHPMLKGCPGTTDRCIDAFTHSMPDGFVRLDQLKRLDFAGAEPKEFPRYFAQLTAANWVLAQ